MKEKNLFNSDAPMRDCALGGDVPVASARKASCGSEMKHRCHSKAVYVQLHG
jgi:hypothetical protein